jgi:hypothetical protein
MPRWTAAIDTIADTVVVRTVSGQVWESDRTLVSEVGIGVLEGEEQYQFGNLRAIAVDAEGLMYAYDAHVPVLRVYSPDGNWLRDVGREGEGPGEYKQPDSGLAILPDGRVALRDPGNGRITLYSADGEYDGFYRIAGSFNTSAPLIADTAGALLTYIVTNLGTSVFEWKSGLARYVAIGISEGYSFDLLRPEGVLRIRRAYDPVPVDGGEAEAERERMTANFRRNYPGWKWNGPPIPPVKPAYDGFYPSEDGRIWVHVPAPSERYMDAEEQKAEEERLGRAVNPYRTPVRFDVFETTGDYLGQVDTPEGFSLSPRPVFRGDTVWATVRDEYDVQRLHRFRLEAVGTD